MQEYHDMVEPFLTHENIEAILEEMRNHPKFFPPKALQEEIGNAEPDIVITPTLKTPEQEAIDKDDDDDWII